MLIYCCECEKDMECNKITGDIVYPNRNYLKELVFWQCPDCLNFVGAHKATEDPLGCIATPELKNARHEIHKLLDPMWRHCHGGGSKKVRRRLYKKISDELGYEYHTAEIRDIEVARKIWKIVYKLRHKRGY